MEIWLLNDIVIVFGLSILVLLLCQKLRVPTIVGFLFTGLLIGPSGFGFITDIHRVETLAEIGVILLLFTIGVEFSLTQLIKIQKSVLLGGGLQVFITIAVFSMIAVITGLPFNEAIFIGFLVALSSTAIVLKTLQERAEIDSPHGQTALGILIFQDVIIVPMILITPILAEGAGNSSVWLLILLLKAIAVIIAVLIAAKWIVPQLMFQIAKTRSQELFLLTVVVICFSVAWLTSKIGLSLALGAFLAGLIISETEYSHAALGNIIPFKSVFTTFFFVSIGMMLDLGFFSSNWILVLLIFGLVFFLKAIIAGSVALILGFPLRTGVLVGCALFQLGEFSFILSKVGVDHGLFSDFNNQVLLSVAIISMAATPFIINIAPRIAGYIAALPLPKRLTCICNEDYDPATAGKEGHLVIVGFGVIGSNVAKAARAADIPYVIVEMNPETVRRERDNGEPICYGDATHENILHHVHVENARIVLVAINDPTATRAIASLVKKLNPKVHLIVRTRYVSEVKSLYELGADEVIPEEFETSVEIFARILTRFLVPKHEIDKLVGEIRSDSYEMFRELSKRSMSMTDLKLHLHDIEISTILSLIHI